MLFKNYKEFREFTGEKVVRYLYLALLLGIASFFIEMSFVYILQGFLISMEVMDASKGHLPDWYPMGVTANSILLALFGLGRFLSTFSLNSIQGIIPRAFERNQRYKILTFALFYPQKISLDDTTSSFSDLTLSGGRAVNCLTALVSHSILAGCLFLYGFQLAPKEMVLGVVLTFLLALPLRMLDHLNNKAAEGLVDEWKNVSNSLVNGIRHNFLFRIYGLLEKQIKTGKDYLNAYTTHYYYAVFIANLKGNIPILVGMLVIAILVYANKTHFHTPGTVFLGFLYIFIRMVQSISICLSSHTQIKAQFPALRDLLKWHTRNKEEVEPESIERQTPDESEWVTPEKIDINHLNFCYMPGENIFSDFNLNLKKGDLLVIQGESGTGKSTLLNLILGLLPSEKGSIKINDQDIDEVKEKVFPNIGYVGPQTYLTSGTIRSNLLFGHPKPETVSDEELIVSLKKCEAWEFIDALPLKLDTECNESLPLSTGQLQRLSIARSLVRKPKLLILDEFTANLDDATIDKVINNLKSDFEGIISILVTHNPALMNIGTAKLQL